MEENKSLIGKLLQELWDLFKRNWPDFVAKLWKKVPDDVEEKVSIGIRIVENLKRFIDSPTADLITAIIPGNLDDKIKDNLRKYLSAWTELKDYIVSDNGDAHVVASKINSELTGMSFGQSALTTEVVFQKMKKNGEL